MSNRFASFYLGATAWVSLWPWSCTSPLTVKDAQAGLALACQTLANVLQEQHPGSPPEAVLLALRACDAERTTRVMSTLISSAAGGDFGSRSTTELLPLELEPLPSILDPLTDAGVSP